MIRFISGSLGAGKTFYAVREILGWIKDGHIVYTNIGFLKTPPGPGELRALPEENVAEFHKHIVGGTRERPTKIVIDEAHLVWGSLNLNEVKKKNEAILTFLTMSRRMGCDVDIITQSEANVVPQIRRLSTWYLNLKNIADHPVLKFIPGFDNTSVCRWFDANGSKSTPDRLQFLKRTGAVWDYYDTQEILMTDAIPIETKEGGRVKISNGRKGWLILGAVLGVSYLMSGKLRSYFQRDPPKAATANLAPLGMAPSFGDTGSNGKPPAPTYLTSYAEIKKSASVRAGVVSCKWGEWVYLATPVGYSRYFVGSQFYGRTITAIHPGRGRGGVTLVLDQGPPLLLMPLNEFRAVEANLKDNSKK